MKPLHIGLLVVGAAIAGGLAVKMTQPSALPSHSPVATATPAPKAVVPPLQEALPAMEATEQPAVTVPDAPPPVYAPEKKISQSTTPARTAQKPPQSSAKMTQAPPPYRAPEPAEPIATTPTLATSPVEQPRTPDPETTPTAPLAPPAPEPRRVTLAAGTTIPARLIQTLISDKLKSGDTFQATLAEPLVVNELVIAERGAQITGRVVETAQAGKFQGLSRLELTLNSFQSADGQKVSIATAPWVKQGESNRNGDLAKIGGGAALGAIIGAIAGGGKGAAIGAGAGAGVGTGAVVLSPSKPITVPTETVIRFRLANTVTITERI